MNRPRASRPRFTMKLLAMLMASSILAGCATQPQRPAQMHSFECDTAAGRASFWSMDLPQGPVKLAGTLRLQELRTHPQWGPAATLFIRKPDRSSLTGFRLAWGFQPSDGARLEFLDPTLGNQAEPVATLMSSNAPLPFSISVSDEGRAVFRLAGFAREFRLDRTTPMLLELGCSTADVAFASVQVE